MPNNPEARSGYAQEPTQSWQATVTNPRLNLTLDDIRKNQTYFKEWFPDPENVTQAQVLAYFRWLLTECSDPWDMLANGTFTIQHKPFPHTVNLEHTTAGTRHEPGPLFLSM